MIAISSTRPSRPLCTPADVLREVIAAARASTLNRASSGSSFLLFTEADVRSRSRHTEIVLAREVYAGIARRFTDASWPEIAVAMGKTSHSSAITAANNMHRRHETDRELRALYGATCLMLAARNLIGVEPKDGVEVGEVERWRRWASGGAA